MSLIGNDNSKNNNIVPGKVGATRGWFATHLAQLMVGLNGMILTCTAFVALNIFIAQIVEERMTNVSYETREHLKDRFGNLEKSIQTASSIVEFSGRLSADEIVQNFMKTFSYEEYYDQIYWLQQQEDSTFYVHKMIKDGDPHAVDTKNAKLHDFVINSLKEDGKGVRLFFEYEGFVSLAGESDYPLVLASVVEREDGKKDIVYGMTSVSHVIAPAFFDFKKSIQELSVVFGEDNVGLYRYTRADASESFGGNAKAFRKAFTVPLADKNVKLDVSVDLGQDEILLTYVPMFVLAFGISLTVIGTLFVRNNQRQSWRLSHMNMELTQINEDLSREVQERERLNQTLRRQEKENRAVIDAVSDIIFETGTDGQILFLNETWQKITGFSIERSLGRNLFDLLYVQDQPEQRSNFAQLVKGRKQAYRAYTRLRTAEGNFRAVELAISMLRQDETKEMRVVGTITDVEDRRRAERALSEAEKKYRAIVENTASGIYQVTPEGQYLSVNPAFARILGHELPENLLRDIGNANIEVYFSPRDRERDLREAIRSGTVTTECQVRRKDGSIIWVQESLRPVKDEDDQLIFFEGSMEDITQRKKAEIALREAKVHSDLASRAKSEFLANMSHELRTPLNAIIGFSDIIRNQAFGNVGSPEYLDYARDINESGKRLLQVINDILDVSRIEAGERPLNEGIVDLSKIVNSCLDMMASKIEANRLIVSNGVNAQTPRLIGEAQAVKQMISNLLSNAIKYTQEGGRITLQAELDGEGELRVSVTDTGIGLTDDEIQKALSPFGQVNAMHSKNESGTGLGLTLVQSLMTLHGGSFELFSQKGIGTTATLVFPAKRVSHTAPKEILPA